MDFEYWLYIILGLAYFISQLRKKQPQRSEEAPEQRTESTEGRASRPMAEKTLTFEDLLREITEGKAPQTRPATAPSPYVDYDDDIAEEEESLEQVDYDRKKRDTTFAMYEDAKRQAFERPSLEDTMKLEDTDLRFGRFKEFDQHEKNAVLESYVNAFRDPEGLKKAIVMSEILKRKF